MDHSNKPYVVIIVIQSIYAGMYILSKVAFDLGMNTFVFVFYRQAAAALFLAPIAMYIERKSKPQLTFNALVKIFLHSLFGITMSLNIYGVGLIFTSASLASATANSIPVITFLLAAVFGMENVKLRTIPGIMKLAGIVLCALGAGTIAFYKGPYLKLLLHHHLFSHYSQMHPPLVHASNQTWIKGVFLMLLANCLWGLWIIFQGNVMKSYPSKLLLTTLECFISSIQSFVIAIAMERDPSQWKLGWNVRLLAVAYCGVVVTGLTYYLQAWVIEMKGPVFLAMTSPLAFVITIVCSAFLLGEILGLGSILGGILLVGGLYCVLWGKSKEQQHIDNGICKPIETEVKRSSDSDGALTTKTIHPSLIV